MNNRENNAANRCQYYLKVLGDDCNVYEIQNFNCDDLGISKHYRCVLLLYSTVSNIAFKLLGQKAQLILEPAQIPCLHGIIERCSDLGQSIDGQHYACSVTLASPLFYLAQRKSTRNFINKTLIEIVNEVLLAAGWSASRLRIKTKKRYPKLQFTSQLQETDHEFIERLLAYHGVFYIFLQGLRYETLCILDDISAITDLKSLTLSYHEPSGFISSEECIFEFHEHVRLLPQQSKDWLRQTFIAKTHCRACHVGQYLTLTRHPLNSYSRAYRVIGIKMSGDQVLNSSTENRATYCADLLLIKASSSYSAVPKPKPRCLQIMPAIVDGLNDDQPYLDEQGRYNVKFPYDQNKHGKGQSSLPIYAMQFYTGAYFPLYPGTQVAVGYLEDDQDQPVILGAISHPMHPDTVTADNKSCSVIRTASGNALCWDDQKDKQHITLMTHKNENSICLDAADDKNKLRLFSQLGRLQFYAGSDLQNEVGINQKIESARNYNIKVGKDRHLLTQQNDVIHQSAGCTNFRATKDIQFQSQQGDIKFDAQRDIQFTVYGNYKTLVQQGDLSFHTHNGDLLWDAGQDVVIKCGNAFNIGQGLYGVTLTKEGDCVINSPNIVLEAPLINVFGNCTL